MRLATCIAAGLLTVSFAVGWVWGYLFAHGGGALEVIAFLHFLPAITVQDFLDTPSISMVVLALVFLVIEFAYFLLLAIACLWLLKLPAPRHAAL